MRKQTILEQFLRDNRPAWQRWAMAVVGFLLLLLAPLLAHAQGGGADTLQLVWTAPGDDGPVGTAAAYQLRVSTAPITLGNWGSANVVGPSPVPLEGGQRQGLTVRGLSTDTTYYFAMRTVDDAGNWSGLSNLLTWDWAADLAAPSTPAGVAGVKIGSDVRITWDPNSDADLDGYSVYRATRGSGPYTRMNPSLLSATEYLDQAVPEGETFVWYCVTAKDLSGNESVRSTIVQVSLAAPRTAWRLPPVFPNPSATSQSVCIPFEAPTSGVGNAVVNIVNAGGYRVRHIPVASAATCSGGSGVLWDGRNDAGRLVAPGVYRAWIISGDTRENVRLVRVP